MRGQGLHLDQLDLGLKVGIREVSLKWFLNQLDYHLYEKEIE